MNTKHTFGPWSQEADGSLVINGQVIAEPSWLAPDRSPREEQLANARLIAAAPELLAQLDRCVRFASRSASTAMARRFSKFRRQGQTLQGERSAFIA